MSGNVGDGKGDDDGQDSAGGGDEGGISGTAGARLTFELPPMLQESVDEIERHCTGIVGGCSATGAGRGDQSHDTGLWRSA